jgi:hypothetical protein
MNRRIIVALLSLLSSPCFAADGTLSSGGWYAGIASGYFFPIRKWDSSYTVGGGGDFFGGYQINAHLAVEIGVNMWLLAGDNNNTWDLKLLPELKWSPFSWKLRPYVFAGVGSDYQLNHPSGTSTWNAVVPLGAGIRWDVHPKYRIFLEAAHYFVLGPPVATEDVPLLFGFSIDI